MKYKVIATYKVPESEDDKAAFNTYFKETHTPICLAVPGITEVRVNSILGGPAGESDLYQISEMVFADKDSWKAAMKTPEMMESGKDAMKFAGKLVSVHFAKEDITTK